MLMSFMCLLLLLAGQKTFVQSICLGVKRLYMRQKHLDLMLIFSLKKKTIFTSQKGLPDKPAPRQKHYKETELSVQMRINI